MKEDDEFLRGIRELHHVGTEGRWQSSSLRLESARQLNDNLRQIEPNQHSCRIAFRIEISCTYLCKSVGVFTEAPLICVHIVALQNAYIGLHPFGESFRPLEHPAKLLLCLRHNG